MSGSDNDAVGPGHGSGTSRHGCTFYINGNNTHSDIRLDRYTDRYADTKSNGYADTLSNAVSNSDGNRYNTDEHPDMHTDIYHTDTDTHCVIANPQAHAYTNSASDGNTRL